MVKEREKEGVKAGETDFLEFDELVASIDETIRKEERAIYTERALAEAYNPKNVGELKNPDGAARITGPCGDTMQIQLHVEGDVLTDVKFVTDGCGASTACGSIITELAKGKTVEGASRIGDKDILAALGGLPEEDVHCALLAANTLSAALEEYTGKKNGDRREQTKV
jgi:nitrogen fixation NifU-like protein